jgi:predicted permease
MAFGLVPALEAARVDLSAVLRERGCAGGRGRRRWARGLVVAQIALALLLLVSAGLTLRSVMKAREIDPGFDPAGVVVATFAPHLQGYTSEREENFFRELLRQTRASNAVSSAAFASHLPLTIEMVQETVSRHDGGSEPDPDGWPVDSARVGTGYFETMRIPLLRGRTFTDRDDERSRCVVLVNQVLAERLETRGNVLGGSLRVEGLAKACTVVGIVATGKYRTLGESPRPFLYKALAQNRERPAGKAVTVQTGTRTLIIRTNKDPRRAIDSTRTLVRRLDERMAITRLTTLEEATSAALILPRFAAVTFGLFGMVGLLLAAIGVYGVMAYAASRRAHEMGIRVALGARRWDILRTMFLEGMTLSAAGLVLGWFGAMALTPLLGFMLYGVKPNDFSTYVSTSIFLMLVAALAVCLPARRASTVEPADVLRYD